ncbi:MAG: DUF973 family protein [Thermoplasmata archaeon]|nr:DUF973 family protein [Thermoplasmata archaeon]MCI4337895.1 DUF973 family protein [Thermoplasmata archaeon]MCI4340783.1 DUF973 family protein [Thermoplasmata archaeon]
MAAGPYTPTSTMLPEVPPPTVGDTWGARGRRHEDRGAVQNLQVAGGVGLAAQLFGWSYAAYTALSGTTSATGPANAAGVPQLSITAGTVELLILIAIIGGILQFIATIALLSAFRELRENNPEFELPARLTWLAVVGIPLLLLSTALLLNSVLGLSDCLATVPSNQDWQTACADPITAVGTAGLVVAAAAVVALIGWAGDLLGIWRAGEYFDEQRFRRAAILLIIPLFSVIGAGLLWWAATRVGKADAVRRYRL